MAWCSLLKGSRSVGERQRRSGPHPVREDTCAGQEHAAAVDHSNAAPERLTASISQLHNVVVYASDVACYHPVLGWQSRPGGRVTFGDSSVPGAAALDLPCQTCRGCREAQAKAWALRCQLELQQHTRAAFTTLTYDDAHVPVTLSRRHLQLYLKRLRKSHHKRRKSARPLRFFACGEYGEQNFRPHFHAIIYGLGETDSDLVHEAWGLGFTRTDAVTPARIAYTAGYTAKKLEHFKLEREERVDYTTGEIYTYQPPFLQMSRGGRNGQGIGSHAREWINSWRLYAVANGYKMPVPRYLHEAWKKQASPSQLEDLLTEKLNYAATKSDSLSDKRLKAAETIALAKHGLQKSKRTL